MFNSNKVEEVFMKSIYGLHYQFGTQVIILKQQNINYKQNHNILHYQSILYQELNPKMGGFEMDIELYFWFIDRGDFEDDQRNKVDMEIQKVQMHREHSQKLENGYYVGKMMHVIRKTIIKKTKKPFNIDPNLTNLKDGNSKQAKEYNWTLIAAELKKFNIKIMKEEKTQILDGKLQPIHELLKKLQTYDLNLATYPSVAKEIGNHKVSTQQMVSEAYGDYRLDKIDINSEINYGNLGKSVEHLEKVKVNNFEADSNVNGVASSENQSSYHFGTDLRKNNKNTKSSSILPNRGNRDNAAFQTPKKLMANSIIQLHRVQPIQDPFDSFDINLSESPLQGGTASYDTPMDLNQNNSGEQAVLDAETPANFLMDSLKLCFNIRLNQVASLLSFNNKQLILMCIRGMRDMNVQQFMSWYNIILNNIGQFVFLLQNHVDQVVPSMNVLRAGLFTKDADLCNLCCRVFTKMATIFNENSQSNGINDVRLEFYDWLIVKQKVTKNGTTTKPPKSPSPNRNAKRLEPLQKASDNEPKDLDQTLTEAGLATFLRAYKKHNQEFIEYFSAFLTQTGKNFYVELFTQHLRSVSQNDLAYLNLIHDLFNALYKTQNGRKALFDSGVLNVLIDMCYSFADNNGYYNTPIKFSGSNNLNFKIDERQSAMIFLIEVWKAKPDFIQSAHNQNRITDGILSVLKKGVRDRSKSVSIISVNLMSDLLHHFARDRNKFAPILYKAYTFLLIEQYLRIDIKEEMINNIISLFKNYPTIPIQILCEPLFKQIMINIEKLDFIDGGQNILQPAGDSFSLNSTDFEFFLTVATHPKLVPSIAVQLLEIVCEISRKNVIFTRIALKLVLTILNRFEHNNQIFDFLQSYIRQSMNLIAAQDQNKMDMYISLMDDPKTRVHARKRSLAGLNYSVDLDGFNNYATSAKNTKNVKLQARERNSNVDVQGTNPAKEHKKGIVSGGGATGHLEIIDDSDLQTALNPNLFQEQSRHYMQMRTREKMVVNQIQCFINTGMKVLVEYIRELLLETYVRIEKKSRFMNKGILYLLRIFDKDVNRMLQYYHKESIKNKDEARQVLIQEQKRMEFLRKQTSFITDPDFDLSYAGSPALQDFSINNKADDTITQTRNQILDAVRYTNQGTMFDAKTPQLKSTKTVARNDKSPLLLQSIDTQVYSSLPYLDQQKHVTIVNEQPDAPRTLKKHGSRKQSLEYEDSYAGEPAAQNRLGVRALSIGRAKQVQFKLYDIDEQDPSEIHKYLDFLKKHLKLYKAIFHKYGTLSQNKNPLKKVITFDDMRDKKKSMTLSEVYAFMNDFKLTQSPMIKRDIVKKVIQHINLKTQSNTTTNSQLDLEGFIEFVLQLGHLFYNRMERASVFMPLLFEYFKEMSLASKQPLFQRLFQDPQATTIGDPVLIKELTRLVNENPDYQLPPGFVKFKTTELRETYKPPDHLKESQQVSLGLLDDLLVGLGFGHYLYPQVETVQKWGVKPDIFQRQIKKNINASYMQISEKYQFKSSSILAPNMKIQQELSLDDTSISTNQGPGRKGKRLAKSSVNALASNHATIPVNKRTMNSSVEPELDMFLKVKLAENILHPNRQTLKEVAYLMDDMLKAVEKGNRNEEGQIVLSPRAKEKIYKNSYGPIGKNNLTKDKYMRQQQDQEVAIKREQLFLNRQKSVKKKLEVFRQQKMLSNAQRDLSVNYKKNQDDQKKKQKEKEKREFYKDLRDQFEKTRLPEINAQAAQDKEKTKENREKKARDRQIAVDKINQNTLALSQSFVDLSKKKQVNQQQKDDVDELEREKRDKVKRRLSIKYYNRQESSIGDSDSQAPTGLSRRLSLKKELNRNSQSVLPNQKATLDTDSSYNAPQRRQPNAYASPGSLPDTAGSSLQASKQKPNYFSKAQDKKSANPLNFNAKSLQQLERVGNNKGYGTKPTGAQQAKAQGYALPPDSDSTRQQYR